MRNVFGLIYCFKVTKLFKVLTLAYAKIIDYSTACEYMQADR